MGGVVWTSIFPKATQLWKKGEKRSFESLAGKSLLIVTAFHLLLTIICMLYAKQITVFIRGESYAGAQHAFRILLLSLIPIGVSNILGGQVLIPSGHEKYL